jgi:hypothetical protein
MTEPAENLPEIQEQKPVSALVAIEQSRAVQEVQAALILAKKFPRDQNAAFTRIMESCKRINLAKVAAYSYPRGGAVVTGPSIRLAEVLAQNYGNLDFGVRELERRNGVSVAESYCWDVENNTRQVKVFEVPHEIIVGKGHDKKVKRLTDPRDIYELVANNGARRLRACILGIIPGDFVEAAVKACKATLAKGDGEPLVDRVRKMLMAFKELGVSQEMIEERMGHKVDVTTAEELVDLQAIYNSVRDKQAKRGDFFNFPEDDVSVEERAAAKDKVDSILKGKANG